MQKANLSEETHKGDLDPGNPGAQASTVDPHGEWTDFLSTGMDSNGQVTGNKAVGAGDKRG